MEKQKLELRHLACYLPYGLKITQRGFGQDLTVEMTCNNLQNMIDGSTGYKPLLIPLSEFNKNLDGNGTMYEQTYNVANLDLSDKLILNISFEQQGGVLPLMDCYSTLQVLFANHFDVFGLINSGLALNKSQS